jgi:hypothetical protein
VKHPATTERLARKFDIPVYRLTGAGNLYALRDIEAVEEAAKNRAPAVPDHVFRPGAPGCAMNPDEKGVAPGQETTLKQQNEHQRSGALAAPQAIGDKPIEALMKPIPMTLGNWKSSSSGPAMSNLKTGNHY